MISANCLSLIAMISANCLSLIAMISAPGGQADADDGGVPAIQAHDGGAERRVRQPVLLPARLHLQVRQGAHEVIMNS